MGLCGVVGGRGWWRGGEEAAWLRGWAGAGGYRMPALPLPQVHPQVVNKEVGGKVG